MVTVVVVNWVSTFNDAYMWWQGCRSPCTSVSALGSLAGQVEHLACLGMTRGPQPSPPLWDQRMQQEATVPGLPKAPAWPPPPRLTS